MSPRNTIVGSDYSRRQFGMLALAGLPFSLIHANATTLVGGVRIGVQSYSFRSMPLDEAIKAMAAIGIEECELFSGHVEPRAAFGVGGPGAGRPPESSSPPATPAPPAPPSDSTSQSAPPALPAPSPARPSQGGGPRRDPAVRDALRKWRLTTPLEHFAAVRKKFDAAGVKVQAYNLSFNDSFTDEEIDRGFEMAKALGVDLITASSTLSAAKRVAPFADKHAITVAMHNHSNVKDPNEFATPESFAKALTLSRRFAVNLDIGHFVAAGFDPVAYIDANHARITNLHLKDRKKDQGDNVPWGEGDTPIKEVLQLLRQKKYDIPANIEYEYRGEDAVAEVRKCFEFCKNALT
jgi:sugar phosphate isomerase/epimerase